MFPKVKIVKSSFNLKCAFWFVTSRASYFPSFYFLFIYVIGKIFIFLLNFSNIKLILDLKKKKLKVTVFFILSFLTITYLATFKRTVYVKVMLRDNKSISRHFTQIFQQRNNVKHEILSFFLACIVGSISF